MKVKIIGTTIIAAVLIVWLVYSHNTPTSAPVPTVPSQGSSAIIPNVESSGDSSGVTLPPSTLPIGKDGLIKAVIPQNLFGGEDKTAEDYVKEYQDEPNATELITSVTSNNDGTVTMIFTPAQLEQFRENIYNNAQFQGSNIETIKDVRYEDDMLTKITVSIDLNSDKQSGIGNGLEWQMSHSLLAIMAGTYQVLSGTPPDDWHTTITIKDADTGKVISTTDYPNPNMYDAS